MAKVIWNEASEAMTLAVLVLPGQVSVDMLIAVFKTRWLSPANQAVIVSAIGDAYRPDYSLVSPAPVQTTADRSASPEFGLPDGRVSMEGPYAHVTRRNARIVALLMSAAEDPDDLIATAAVWSYSEFAEASDALRLARRAFYRGGLSTGTFIRHAFALLPNLDTANQEALIDEVISAERADPERTGDPSLRTAMMAFFGPDQAGMASLSPAGRASFRRYLDSVGPDPLAVEFLRMQAAPAYP
ncbi:hypothetical protein [Pigmentiphaga litoralis]|uniref:hypothetical protein n=1 Tax=Pigmentiphaga litoralis TaxID=516702 RepID=UPI00167B66FA|nr:hypothetical protein [Pigmentiphaga litoralis]